MTIPPSELPGRIEAMPGMDRLLPALSGLDPAHLVGGAVRDLLRGADRVDLDLDLDLDVAVEGDARAAARELGARLGGAVIEHERFGTATVTAPGLVVDLAATRRERYPHPGALPEVEPAPLEQDLARRDFTVNAMAAALSPGRLGALTDPHGGVADLESRAIRVLHRDSFRDDPTRLLRAVRYEARLGFAIDPDTERLVRRAAAGGALRAVSGPRVRDELLDLLAEPQAAAAVARLDELALDRSMDPALGADADLVASAALGASETGADRVLAELAALIAAAPAELRSFVERLGLARDERDRVLRAATIAPELARALEPAMRPSEVRALLARAPREALALALAHGAPAEPILRYVSELQGVRLEITGDDLVSAGVPASAAVGRALERTLALKLDGEVAGRDEELRAALELARGERPSA